MNTSSFVPTFRPLDPDAPQGCFPGCTLAISTRRSTANRIIMISEPLLPRSTPPSVTCQEVMQVENTRLPVESPAEKVKQSETIVGLANHTILVRRDGSEVHIDDSAAPSSTTGTAIQSRRREDSITTCPRARSIRILRTGQS